MSVEGERSSLVPQIEKGVTTALSLLLLLSLLFSLLHSPPTNMCETMTREVEDDDSAFTAMLAPKFSGLLL